jgi:hypothetical protein
MDQTALKHGAYERGQQGLPLYDRAAIDIGSTVHHIAESRPQGPPRSRDRGLCSRPTITEDEYDKKARELKESQADQLLSAGPSA